MPFNFTLLLVFLLSGSKQGRQKPSNLTWDPLCWGRSKERGDIDCFSSSFACLEICLKCGRPEVYGPSTIEVTCWLSFLDSLPYYHYLSDHWQLVTIWMNAWQYVCSTDLYQFLMWVSGPKHLLLSFLPFHSELLQEDAAGCHDGWCAFAFATCWSNDSVTCRLSFVAVFLSLFMGLCWYLFCFCKPWQLTFWPCSSSRRVAGKTDLEAWQRYKGSIAAWDNCKMTVTKNR